MAPPTRDREIVDLALDELRIGEGTALGDAIAKAVEVGQTVGAAGVAGRATDADDGPRRLRRQGGRRHRLPQEASGQARERDVPVFTVGMGTPDGVVEVPLAGGYTARVEVPADPTTLRRVAAATGGRFFSSPTLEQLQAVYAELESRLGREDEWREVTVAFAAGGASCSSSGSAVSELVQEAPVRAAPVLVASATALVVLAAPSARAADECRGLPVCIPVAGPWVVVPPGDADARFPQRSWHMKCPEGSIVGGVDARLTHRAVDMSFSGLLGSPVNPGITTTEEVVFTGTYTGGAPRPTGFRPFIGCVPTAGGGRIPTAVKPGSPTELRVRTVSFTTTASATHSCSRGQRLISSTHAVALRSGREPASRSWPASVRSSRAREARRRPAQR